LSEEQRRAKLDMLQAKAQAEQLQFLQTEQGKFMMQNKTKLSPAQREFVEGLEKNAASLSAQGIDINKASAAEIEAAIAAKRAEQERQGVLDAGMNRFQSLMTNIGSMLQTGFFTLVKDGLNMAFAAFDKLGTTLKPVIDVVKMTGDEFQMVASRIGEAFNNVVLTVQPMIDMIRAGFTSLSEILGPVTGLFTDYLMPAIQGVSDFIQENLTPIVGAVVAVLSKMAIMALPAIISGLVAFGASLVTAAAAILAPFLPVILAVGAVTAGFILLKKAGFDVQTALEAIKDNLYKYMFLPFKEIFVNLLSFLPKRLGGYSKEEEAAAKQGLADEKEALASRATARDATRAENRKENAIAAEKVKEENKKFREEKAAGRAQQEAAQAKKDAIKTAESADAMERSKQRALTQMREMAGIEKPAAAPAVTPAPAPAPTPGAAPPINQDQAKNLELIKNAMVKQGITDPKMIAATLGNVMKESGGKTQSENLNYKNTSNERVRSIFKSATKGKTDAEVEEMKSSPEKMAEANYGAGTKLGAGMGNTEVGDGWKFRGRGFIQLTGKSNYSAASKAIFGDDRLVKNPDMANDPAVAAEISAWYMKRGNAGMAKRMGIDMNNMSQAQANALATSTIAGTDVVKAGGYLGGETLGKVNKFAGSSQIAAIAGAPATTQTAAAKPQLSEQDKLLMQNRSKLSPEQQAQLEAESKTATQTASASSDEISSKKKELNIAMMRGKMDDVKRLNKELGQLEAESKTATQTAASVNAVPKSVTADRTAPTGAQVQVATATKAQEQKTAADKAAADKKKTEEETKTTAENKQASETQDPMAVLLADLNTTMVAIARLQGQAVAIAEQQLRATKGMSRDAYTAIG
jgi:predicted chitinase